MEVILNHNILYILDGDIWQASGLCCELSFLGAGRAIGIVGNVRICVMGHYNRIFAGMILILIFSEAL